MKKRYVIKNKVTGRYYGGSYWSERCNCTNINNAHIIDYKIKKSSLNKNEELVEIELKEKRK